MFFSVPQIIYSQQGHIKLNESENKQSYNYEPSEIPEHYKVDENELQKYKGKNILSYGRTDPTLFNSVVSAPSPKTNDPQNDQLDHNTNQGGKNEQEENKATKITGFSLPVDRDMYNITSGFGERDDPFTGESAYHYGIDIGGIKENGKALIEGRPVYSFCAGIISFAGENGNLGNCVKIDHMGIFETVYGHLSSIDPDIKIGTTVNTGQTIGKVGNTGRSTGPHLHFEMKAQQIPIDPAEVLDTLLEKGN